MPRIHYRSMLTVAQTWVQSAVQLERRAGNESWIIDGVSFLCQLNEIVLVWMNWFCNHGCKKHGWAYTHTHKKIKEKNES